MTVLDQPLEDLADRLGVIFIESTDCDLWHPKAAWLVREIADKLGVNLSDDELGQLMMRVRERSRLGLGAKPTGMEIVTVSETNQGDEQ